MTDQNEVDQLKRRVAELESHPQPGQKKIGCGTYVLLGLAALAVIAFFARSCSDASPAPEKTAAAAGPSCNAAWSSTTIETARATRLVRDMAVRKDGLHIIADVPKWRLLTMDQRDQVVSAADCAIAGPGYLKAVTVETPDGVTLKSYTAFDLLEARKLQGALTH